MMYTASSQANGKFTVGRPVNLDNSTARTCCACSKWGRVGAGPGWILFLSSVIFFSLPPLSGRRLDID